MEQSRTWRRATPLLVYLTVLVHVPQTRGQDKAQASLAFKEHIIANDLRGGYHVAVADPRKAMRLTNTAGKRRPSPHPCRAVPLPWISDWLKQPRERSET